MNTNYFSGNMFDRIKKALDYFFQIYQGMSRPVKAAVWLTICSIFQKGIAVLTVPVFTRLLSSEDYGTVSVYVSWANIFSILTSLSVFSGAFNTAMARYEKNRNEYVSAMLGLSAMMTVIWIGIYFLFQEAFINFTGLPAYLLNIMSIQLILAPAFNLWIAKERFEYQYTPIVLVTAGMSILSPVVSAAAVILMRNSAAVKIISAELISDIFYLFIFIFILMKGRKLFVPDYWKYTLKINIPLIPHFLSGTILNQADRVMINSFCGSAYAGMYSVAYSSSMLLTILNGSINSSLVPWLYKQVKDNKTESIAKTVNVIIFGMFLVVSIYILCAPELIAMLAPDEYRQAIVVVPPVTASVFFWFVFGLFVNIELYYEKSWGVTLASVTSAVINIILNDKLIPRYGFAAAGYTTLASYLLYTGLHYIFMKRILNRERQGKNIYDIRILVIVSICMLLLCALTVILYQHSLLRYLSILILAGWFAYKLKGTAKIIKAVKEDTHL